MDMHQVANSIAAFSFLTSSAFVLMVRIPHLPEWGRLRLCRVFLALAFGIVGLSCLKTVLLSLPTSREVIETSTLISGGFQAFMFCCTGLTFVAPRVVNLRFVVPIMALLLANAVGMVSTLVLWPSMFHVSLIVSLVIYVALIVYYQMKFFRHYNHLVAVTDEVTDEYSDYDFRWIKGFYVSVTVLGISVVGIVFSPIIIYDLWMLVAAFFYAYVVVCFVNYLNRNAMLVKKVYDQMDQVGDMPAVPCMGDAVPQAVADNETTGFQLLEERLEQWVKDKRFVENDIVSKELAAQLGVGIDLFRAYFKERLHTDFRQWRMKQRIDYACEIMKEHPSYAYGMVAQLVGINDRSNFTKAFVKIKGVTPKEYLEQCNIATIENE